MKIDCNITKNFLNEWRRMCKDYDTACEECKLRNFKEPKFCTDCLMDAPDEGMKIIQEWSDEHPIETRMEHFIKMFPNTAAFGVDPHICVRLLNRDIEITKEQCREGCVKCWNEPYTEGEF